MTFAPAILIWAVAVPALHAQGITSAALRGSVVRDDGSPVADAHVRVTHTATGGRWEITTRSSGIYHLEAIPVGGPYRVDVRALGLAPVTRTGLMLPLGQRVQVDFRLTPAVVELSAISVSASKEAREDRSSPGALIAADRIANLPNHRRDYLTLLALSPHVAISPSANQAPTGGITIGGQNRMLNAFQIDGGLNHDVYTGRINGRDNLPAPISLDAIEEIQVLVAPFDVRHSGFAGGLANAVSKSGTNELRGLVFAYRGDGSLIGRDASGAPAEGFTLWQYGGTLGGPLVRNRAHFFVSTEIQRRMVPDPGPLVTDTVDGRDTLNIGIRHASARRFQDLLRGYGVDPGTLGPVDRRVPANDILGKVSMQLSTNNRLEISHHYTDGTREGFVERAFSRYRLSSLASRNPATVHATRGIATSIVGKRWLNELIASRFAESDVCQPAGSLPLIQVNADKGMLIAGTAVTCPLDIAQRVFELTNNATTQWSSHTITVGARMEMLRFDDAQLQTGAGLWRFASLDALQAGTANRYERAFWASPTIRSIGFRARQYGTYIQDGWSPTSRLHLMLGLRADGVSLPDRAGANPLVASNLGIETGRLPIGGVIWSPRAAFNHALSEDRLTSVRGGVGLFSGRPPYAWIASAYRDNGARELLLICLRNQVRSFDPVNQPTTCVNGAPARPRFAFFDRTARYPQNLKAALGLDHVLPHGVSFVGDVIYTRATHQLSFADANLIRTGVSRGEADRPLYGAISAAGVATAQRRDSALGQVIQISDRAGDYSISASAHLRKRFGNRGEVTAFYSFTRARDRMSLVNLQSRPNFETTPIDGSLETRRMATSYFEIPNRLQVVATTRLPHRTSLALSYNGSSGMPYTWTIIDDANADGVGGGLMTNDAVYVPRDSQDILLDTASQWATLDAMIRAERCLQRHRGRILPRNSCRNPSLHVVNARVTHTLASMRGQSVELIGDIYNVLSLFRRAWGTSRLTTLNPEEPLLDLQGYDTTSGRGRYNVAKTPSALRQVQDLASRWQVQFGARYTF